MKQIEEKQFVIATHVYVTGPSHDLRDYLNKIKVKNVLFIGHPLFYEKNLKGSGFELYLRGEIKIKKYNVIRKYVFPINYIKDILLNLFYTFKYTQKNSIFIGVDNLNTFSGIILRKLGRIDKVIYYVIDYNPKRFNNKLLNNIFHWLDQFCVKNSDETWNLSERMETARKEHFNFIGGTQKIVPIGVWLNRIKTIKFEDINRNSLVFMGHIMEKQGVQCVIDAIPLIIKEIPSFNFLIIGQGEYLDTLKNQAADLKVKKYIDFTGYIEKHETIESLLLRNAAAIALYKKYESNGDLSFTYYADPAKIKSYLAAGLPIILTDVPHNAAEIEKMKCGIITSLNKEKIAAAVIKLLKNNELLKEYRENAIQYSQQFDWDVIFTNALK